MTATCPSCGGPKSAPARRCAQCYLRARPPRVVPQPSRYTPCACGGSKARAAIRCIHCEKRRRHEKKRHVCAECGVTFFRRADSRPDRPYRTNLYCKKRCHLIVLARQRSAVLLARRNRRREERAAERARLLAITQARIRAAQREQTERIPPPCVECGGPVLQQGLGRPRRFCSRACGGRFHHRLTRYRQRSGIPEMQYGDELYEARRALGRASFALQQMGTPKITGGPS
jgi:hypothetical protein